MFWVGVLQNHRPPTDRRPPTHRQVLHQPSDHQLIDRSSTDPPITDLPTLLQLTKNPLTHQSYFNRVTIGPILLTTNFNSLFAMGTIYC